MSAGWQLLRSRVTSESQAIGDMPQSLSAQAGPTTACVEIGPAPAAQDRAPITAVNSMSIPRPGRLTVGLYLRRPFRRPSVFANLLPQRVFGGGARGLVPETSGSRSCV